METLYNFYNSLIADDLNSFQYIIEKYLDINQLIDATPPNLFVFGRPPFPLLNLASSFGAYQCVFWLLEQDVYIDSTDGFENTPLHCAAFSGNEEILKLLLLYNGDPYLYNKNGDLPIHIAASYNKNCILEVFIHSHPDMCNIKNFGGKTILTLGVEKDNIGLVRYLIDTMNCDPKIIDNCRNTLMHIAVQYLAENVAPYLVSLGKININNINDDSLTPLLLSSMQGSFIFFSNLLLSKADYTILDRNGRSILHHSIKSKNFELVEYILKNKLAFPSQEDNFGYTPMHSAVETGDIKFVQLIAQYDYSQVNNAKCGFSPLHIACKHNNFEILHFLLNLPNVDYLLCNTYKQNLLHIAARLSSDCILSFLLKSNAFDISLPDTSGVIFIFNLGLLFILLLKKGLIKWLIFF